MVSVIHAFAVMGTLMVVGFLVGRSRLLGTSGEEVLGKLLFNVVLPALLITSLGSTAPSTIFSPLFVVTALAEISMCVAVFVLYRLCGRAAAPSLVAGMIATYSNGAFIGIPIATYILGDSTPAVLLIVFQTAIYAPIALTILDILTHPPGGNRRERIGGIVRAPLTNPIVLSSVTGLLITLLHIPLPGFLLESLGLISQAAVGIALLYFGISLANTMFLASDEVRVGELAGLTVAKSFLQPACAAGIAVALGLDGPAVLAAATMGALPTAQNVFVYSSHYGVTPHVARDAGVTTAVLAFPVMMVVVALLGAP